MGMLVDGKWQSQDLPAESDDGRFVRQRSHFRNWVTADGSPGESGQGGFPAEAGRYHLFVSLACPWAHRTLIFRVLKDLKALIGVTVVEPVMGPDGWRLPSSAPAGSAAYLHEVYSRADPHYTGRASVPVLWDTKRSTIVSNESSEIIRMFNSAFDDLTGNRRDFYPPPLRAEIDGINEEVYANVNNGVYRAGFARTQAAYEEAFVALFDTLGRLEDRLLRQRYLCGNAVTEADWRLFTTLVRFDPVYYGHFKCNLRRIADFPNLPAYLRDLYQQPGIAGTVDINQIKQHYYASHRSINPTGIVPLGPEIDYGLPHDRDRFAAGPAAGHEGDRSR